ncbi:MAG: hypothetical protein KF802_01135 [Bdellovibrionaceae bacterium]|nr:hypothetical protein [Pseudobdellovibrionaceae bacterium]MBX3034324.1 hypothetical protein [Pseudobdellovibrionaceae bacterium]
MSQSGILTLFPCSVYHAPLFPSGAAARNRDLREEALRLSEVDEAGIEWSRKNYPGGYTSYGSMDRLHEFSSSFEALRKRLDTHVAKFVKHLELDVQPRDLQMRSCWVNVMPAQVVHTMHIHPLSVISGTYYVQTPAGAGSLKFEDPRLGFFMGSPPAKAKAKPQNQRFYNLKPKAGDVVLFESWMRHEVPPNQSHQDRISISFNYDWTER